MSPIGISRRRWILALAVVCPIAFTWQGVSRTIFRGPQHINLARTRRETHVRGELAGPDAAPNVTAASLDKVVDAVIAIAATRSWNSQVGYTCCE